MAKKKSLVHEQSPYAASKVEQMGVSSRLRCRNLLATTTLALVLLCVANVILRSQKPPSYSVGTRRLMMLALSKKSPLLSSEQSMLSFSVTEILPIYIVWYGNFSDAQKSIVQDFFNSFDSRESSPWTPTSPSVKNWWKATGSYKDARGSRICPQVQLESEISDISYSMGRKLSNASVQELVLDSLRNFKFEANPNGFYFVLTSEDVAIESFCSKSCASRSHVAINASIQGSAVRDGQSAYHFAWVGNSAKQCARKCAWPLALPDLEQGPRTGLLLPPNDDVGMDGMIINIASMLADAVTIKSDDTVFIDNQRKDAVPLLDVVTACSGVFGEGAYPGYPGHLWKEKISGISFNAFGANDRRFLLPALWDRETLKCSIPS